MKRRRIGSEQLKRQQRLSLIGRRQQKTDSEIQRLNHNLRSTALRRSAFLPVQMAKRNHRRGASSQEQKLQAHRRPPLHGRRTQGATHRYSASEQRRGAILAPQLPRAAAVPLERRVHAGVRRSQDRHSGD